MVLSHFQFILIIPSSLFIDWIVLDLLRLYVWLYFSFVFFSSVPPPRSTGREYCSLTSLHIQLEEKECIAWTFPFWTMALDNNYGAFAVYLCFLYASLNNVIKTVMKMLCFWKDVRQSWWCCCNTYLLLWNKSCCFSAIYKYVFLYLSCISVTYTYKPPPKLGHSIWEWP